MFIGKLNEKSKISLKVTKRDLQAEPLFLSNGNPFLSEPLRISWLELFECGIDLNVTLDQKYFINTCVFTNCSTIVVCN